MCDPSVFVDFAEQILNIYSVQSSLPVKLDRLRVYELEKLILVVYAVGDYGRGIPLVPFRFYRFGGLAVGGEAGVTTSLRLTAQGPFARP